MTGYASAQQGASATGAETEGRAPQNRRLGLEIRSVNSRFLDLSFRLPDDLRALEPRPAAQPAHSPPQAWQGGGARRHRKRRQQHPARPTSALCCNASTPCKTLVKAWLPGAAPLSVADALRLCANANTSLARLERSRACAGRRRPHSCCPREREGKRLATMVLDRAKQLRALAQQAVPLVPLLVEQATPALHGALEGSHGLTDGAYPCRGRPRPRTD